MNSSLQLRELMIAYSLTAGAMLVGLLLMRADSRAYFRWPVYSVMVMALGVVLWNLARKHLITDAWLTSHAELCVLRCTSVVSHARLLRGSRARSPDANRRFESEHARMTPQSALARSFR